MNELEKLFSKLYIKHNQALQKIDIHKLFHNFIKNNETKCQWTLILKNINFIPYIDYVIDRIKVFMDSNNYDVLVHKSYHKSRGNFFYFHRLINKYKGKLSYVRIEFKNRKQQKPVELNCWDIVPNNAHYLYTIR